MPNSNDHTIRQEVHYRGHVQGVGFRYTTSQIARQFLVVGYVQNLPGGSVKLVVEGENKQVADFLAEIAQRMGDHIQDQEATTSPATNEYESFQILH